MIPYLDLLDYRRRVATLYAEIRACSDPRAAWNRWREIRDWLFGAHPQSALPEAERTGFSGLDYFDYDPAWRLVTEIEALPETPADQSDAGADGVMDLIPFAETRGLTSRLGKELTLYWLAGYGGGVFLPFRDGTNGRFTYGGGRYLIDSIKGADLGATEGRLILDFNFAYNPSCAYSPVWVCPLAPSDNGVAVPVEAGEKQAAER